MPTWFQFILLVCIVIGGILAPYVMPSDSYESSDPDVF